MRYLIDGYNVIGASHHVDFTDKDKEEKLTRLLCRFLRSRDSAVLYFDGRRLWDTLGGREQRGAVLIRYTPSGISADAAIRTDMQKATCGKKGLCIVSSDREIQAAARQCRIAYMPSDGFIRQLYAAADDGSEHAKPNTVSDLEFKYWQSCFQQRK